LGAYRGLILLMKTVLPASAASALGLAVVGDEIELTVSAVNPDGSVEVESYADTPAEDAATSSEPPKAIGPADLPMPPMTYA